LGRKSLKNGQFSPLVFGMSHPEGAMADHCSSAEGGNCDLAAFPTEKKRKEEKRRECLSPAVKRMLQREHLVQHHS
jgi:hypothetical protein